MADVTEDAADVLRLARAGIFAAVCVVTTALGHAVMSGDVLPWWALGLAFTVTTSGAWWLTGPERGAATVVGATVVTQGLLHLLFSLAHQLIRPPTAAAGLPGADHGSGTHGVGFSHFGMVMHHSVPMGAQAPSPPLVPTAMHGTSAGMFLAHLLAAVACGLWLWRGEAAAHRIGRALAATFFAPLRRVCRVLFRTTSEGETPACRAAVGGGDHGRAAPTSLRHAVVRRGPPRDRPVVARPSPDPLLAVRL
ncbi:hypothetical protein OG604_30885 [Streptomyces sp. NBC_01231]|nr:hypothetical protein OG604_30885 [Streptomyces sp. NBC_01231]